jgi:hypothetical protein
MGNNVLHEHPDCTTINVYEMIFGCLSQLNTSLVDYNGFNVLDIVSEFLKQMLAEANQVFDQFSQEEQERLILAYRNQTIANTEDDEEMEYRARKRFKFGPDRCRYCISGPLDESYRNLIRRACINAEIITDGDPQDRLMFVNDAEALGYSMISALGTGNEYPNKYIICDVNDNFVNFAEITIDITQTTSSVVACTANLPRYEVCGLWRDFTKITYWTLVLNKLNEDSNLLGRK